jgi:hypothetical protein
MGNYATKAELQEDAASWVWHQIDEGPRSPVGIGPAINTPDWSEFDAITPDGNRVVVRVELKP